MRRGFKNQSRTLFGHEAMIKQDPCSWYFLGTTPFCSHKILPILEKEIWHND